MPIKVILILLLCGCSNLRADIDTVILNEVNQLLSEDIKKVHLALNPYAPGSGRKTLSPIVKYKTYEGRNVDSLLGGIRGIAQWRQGRSLFERGEYYVFFENDKKKIVLALRCRVEYGSADYFSIIKADFSTTTRNIVIKGLYATLNINNEKNRIARPQYKLIYLEGFSRSNMFFDFIKGRTMQISPSGEGAK